MPTNNLLLTVTDLDLISDIKKVQDCTFLFPLEGFCCGYPKCYTLDQITESNSYLLINRILTDNDLADLKNMLICLPTNIKGIIFEDIGVLELINELGINIEKIYYMIHNGVNYQSINAYLKYVDSVVISSDITKEEITEILENVHKPCVVYTFGLLDLMYSRRTLLSNYNRYYDLPIKESANVVEPITKKSFKAYENANGTIFYSGKYYYTNDFFNISNVKYNWVNPIFMDKKTVLNLINEISEGNYNLNLETDPIFLNQKSIISIKGDK